MPLFLPNSGVTAPLTLASGTITEDAPALNLSQTWNNGAVTFTGLKFNVTDTASASVSLLADFQVGGVSKGGIYKSGSIQFSGNATFTAGSLTLSDTVLTRSAANSLAIRNGANAQTFITTGTYTDSGNYRRLRTTMTTAGAATIVAEGLGTGVSGNTLALSADGTTAVTFTSSSVSFGTMNVFVATSNALAWNGSKSRIYCPLDSHLLFQNNAQSDADFFLKLGVNTSAACGIKRVGTELRARLNDDSAYAFITGKLRTDTNYAAGTFTATGYLTVYDLAGTAYRIPCAV